MSKIVLCLSQAHTPLPQRLGEHPETLGAPIADGSLNQERDLWEASLGRGMLTRKLMSGRDLVKIAGVMIARLVFYKIMVEISAGPSHTRN